VQPGQPDRHIALPRRTAAECLAEELRRLDADEVYAETLIRGMGRVKPGTTVRATGERSPARTRRPATGANPEGGAHELGPGVFPAPATSAAGTTVSPTPAPTARDTGVRKARAATAAARAAEGVGITAAPEHPTPDTPTAGTRTPEHPTGGASTDGTAAADAAAKRTVTARKPRAARAKEAR